MTTYITGDAIRALRERAKLTQRQLAEGLGVTDKAVSKWETGRGLPDISLVEPLARALDVSVAELFSGERIVNANRAGNLLRSCFYVCPVCGNVVHATGGVSVSCCGIQFPPCEAEEDGAPQGSEGLIMEAEAVDGEVYVRVDHEMRKEHFVSFLAYVTTDHVLFRKLYPQQVAEARFPYKGPGQLYAFCNQHGLFSQRAPKPVRSPSRRTLFEQTDSEGGSDAARHG